ncbi:MAG TPA: LysM peptidoglycan-binding domain-containing protein [Candidatus Acidoferrum sp.]|nr:LysM peptidoglycan-binding domain-containing protein [Candidatus Acidoferrum sp.]
MFRTLSTRSQLAPLGVKPFAFARFAVAIFASSILLVNAPQLRAQSSDSQQDSQDVADAARQARARKQQASGRHVYTNEDLRREKILTPDDRSRAAAAKQNSQPLPAVAQPSTQSLDANSALPQEPLGDVARRYQAAKKVSPFHLPANRPQFASPKIVAPVPELKPMPLRQPQPPARNFDPSKPALPLSRGSSPHAPVLPSARAQRIDPFVGRRSAQPTAPVVPTVRPSAPSIAASPSASAVNSSRTPSGDSRVIVQPGDTLWTLSRQHLGRGTRWLELMAVNPDLPDPTRLVPGTALTLPAKNLSARRTVPAHTVTVQGGDSLSKLALAAYGRASYWPCIAQANPMLTNPHLLAVGQQVTLPASCTP